MLRLGLQGAPLFLLTCPGMTEWAVLPTRVCVCVCVCTRERDNEDTDTVVPLRFSSSKARVR